MSCLEVDLKRYLSFLRVEVVLLEGRVHGGYKEVFELPEGGACWWIY